MATPQPWARSLATQPLLQSAAGLRRAPFVGSLHPSVAAPGTHVVPPPLIPHDMAGGVGAAARAASWPRTHIPGTQSRLLRSPAVAASLASTRRRILDVAGSRTAAKWARWYAHVTGVGGGEGGGGTARKATPTKGGKSGKDSKNSKNGTKPKKQNKESSKHAKKQRQKAEDKAAMEVLGSFFRLLGVALLAWAACYAIVMLVFLLKS